MTDDFILPIIIAVVFTLCAHAIYVFIEVCTLALGG